MAVIKKERKYKWEFDNVGGTTRVKITKGEDIAHLDELDPKMWTVLSCPINGLAIDEKSLAYMDCDSDGKIRVSDVICTSKWVTGALNDPDLLLAGKDSINLNDFNKGDSLGGRLYNSSKQILDNLGRTDGVITLADTADMATVFAKTKFNGDGVITEATADDAEVKAAVAAAVKVYGGVLDRSGAMGVDASTIETFYKDLADYSAWLGAVVAPPFGDKTDTAVAAYKGLDAKVRDFFVRSHLAAFSPESTNLLDVRPSEIDSISTDDLTEKMGDIASYPVSRVTGKAEIDLTAPVNPAWASQFSTLMDIVASPDKKTLTEEDWNEIGAKFAAYAAWKNAKVGAAVEVLGAETVGQFLAQDRKADILALIDKDASLKEDYENIKMVDKFLHVFRDFYRLLRNFVTLHDFYDKDRKVNAIFQAGRLLVDQRECRFCMNIADVAKHSAMAASSGMYLIYCDCSNTAIGKKLQIVAAVTVGEIGDLVVGKNAVYYDEQGEEYDAVVTKIIDNPISIAQAFWSPYRRIAVAIENLISKNAADKDAKIMKDATAKLSTAAVANPAAADSKVAAQPFDIGKFAGIFAALGMAVGMIGTALASLAEGLFALEWWQVIIAFVGVMLVISGPAMVMAWLKLRRRNIAPLLNANGWAVNASSKIGIPFGETLTDVAKFPKIKLRDPYKREGMPAWKKWLISVLSLAFVLAMLWLANMFAWASLPSPLPHFQPEDAVEIPVEFEKLDSTQISK